jgi:hypothetical protein
VRRKDTDMDTLLEAQGEISELLDELFGDGLA